MSLTRSDLLRVKKNVYLQTQFLPLDSIYIYFFRSCQRIKFSYPRYFTFLHLLLFFSQMSKVWNILQILIPLILVHIFLFMYVKSLQYILACYSINFIYFSLFRVSKVLKYFLMPYIMDCVYLFIFRVSQKSKMYIHACHSTNFVFLLQVLRG